MRYIYTGLFRFIFSLCSTVDISYHTRSLAHAMKFPRHCMFLIGPSPWCKVDVLYRLRNPFSFSTNYKKQKRAILKADLST